MSDAELIRLGATALGSVLTTGFGVMQWLRGSFGGLNKRMTELSSAIVSLDKNLAIQSVLFNETIKNLKCKNGACKHDL